MAKVKVKNTPKVKSVQSSGFIEKFSIADALMMLLLVILCATCVMPFIHLAAKSISGNSYVVAKAVTFWPKGITWDAYASIFRDGTLVYSMIYSVIVTLVFTILGMSVCTCAAYPLSKRYLKGRVFFTTMLMIPMYFGAGLIPTYLLLGKNGLNIIDTVWVLILPLIYSPYNMLIMKTNLQNTIPDSLEEAATLDGATQFQTLFKIILPMAKPVIATLSLYYAVGRWNSYSDNMYYIKTDKLKMVQYKLYQMVASASEAQSAQLSEAAAVTSTPEVLQAAFIMFVTVPIICIYPFLQKYFVKGTMVGAVKG